jgi:photosystem II stability/assembly factor-like uncharacterized protein
VIFVSTGAFVTLARDGRLALSGDGLNWSSVGPIPSSGGMSDIAFAFANNITPTYAAVGTGGQIWMNSGGDLKTWTQVIPSPTPNDLTSVSLLNGSFYATGTGGTLLTNPSGSGSWTSLTSNTPNTLRGVAFGPSSALQATFGTVYVAVGDAGTIINSFDNGQNWNPVNPSTFNPPFTGPLPNLQSIVVGGSAGTRFLAVGQNGAVVFSDDGANWSTWSSGPSNNLAKVFYAGGMYIGVGDAGVQAVSR